MRFNDRIIPLLTSNIAYIYSEEKNNYLVTFDEQRYIIDSSLDVVSEEFNPDAFFRISRVAEPASSFEMTVSRSRVDDFLKWLEK